MSAAMFSDELPPDARALIEQAEQDIIAIQAQAESEIDTIQNRAEEALQQIRERADQATQTIQDRLSRERTTRTEALFQALYPLQVAYVKEGKLDEALAIRERARQFRGQLLNAQPDPGNLSSYSREEIGSELLFEVTGSSEGTVWGTDMYTTDSPLAVASVHAGALRPGERGVVRVRLFDGLNVAFNGSHRNGVWSLDFPEYPMAFQVRRA